jgi:hypothetical protein
MASEVQENKTDKLVNDLYEIRDLVELAEADHPEDYNLEQVYVKLTKILEDYE